MIRVTVIRVFRSYRELVSFSKCYLGGEHIRRRTSQQGLAYLWEQHKGVFVGRSQGRFRLWSVNMP